MSLQTAVTDLMLLCNFIFVFTLPFSFGNQVLLGPQTETGDLVRMMQQCEIENAKQRLKLDMAICLSAFYTEISVCTLHMLKLHSLM